MIDPIISDEIADLLFILVITFDNQKNNLDLADDKGFKMEVA